MKKEKQVGVLKGEGEEPLNVAVSERESTTQPAVEAGPDLIKDDPTTMENEPAFTVGLNTRDVRPFIFC